MSVETRAFLTVSLVRTACVPPQPFLHSVIYGIGTSFPFFDLISTSNAQAQIFSALGRDDLLAWIVLAHPAAAACIMPLFRRLSVPADLKLQFYIHSIVFVVGVVISGTAKDMNARILGRAVSGAGGAGLYHG
ncbi:hypothetical protein OOU_Y34scaffold00972g2 [Pyricularia oryzae Y34]|uniref:Uncharacterized protein n=2 Tax=Pyricularia oryzae TaxID=318829 RepID=A0AA97NNF3_PYRO3|nr:hypothetical protein OOU_Y34scaffold00972g2 [Pyricularia oryzae Y34]